MMNLFGSKKGKSAKSSRRSSKGSVCGKDDLPAQPSWPSLSPAASMTLSGADGKCDERDRSPTLETKTSDLIASYAPALNLQVHARVRSCTSWPLPHTAKQVMLV